MKKLTLLMIVCVSAASCSHEPVAVTEETYENGSPKLVRYYKNQGDTIPVKETHLYNDGTKRMEGAFREGKRHGEWKYWYANGNLWSAGTYTEGKENGRKAVYHENGQLYYEGNLNDGKRTGNWKFFDKNGKLQKEVDYGESLQ
ncbi:MAG: hypothetical protein JXA03_06070 [Bacteroidales bacterium]|nr:hypothetical protein [Bacteroidales bacterium]